MTLTDQKNHERAIRLASGGRLPLSHTLVMGVLNVTPDSFSDGGIFREPARAVEHALAMERQGADIIDVGGESTRPGADPVPAGEEIRRVIPVIEGIRRTSSVPLSIDTFKAATARAALDAGADIVNDISALRFDEAMAELLASRQVPVILMHMLGTPRTMQIAPSYENCVAEITEFFKERLRYCDSRGIDRERVILDPGIGFGKRLQDNLDILANLREFKKLGQTLLTGTSRKSFINKVNPSDGPASARLGGSIASMITAAFGGADIVRVHDVAETVEALKVARAIRKRQ
ncbi:MAG: dihydropteroate synthase [Candidatus Zixiibacteriota bacterium]|nr:MAG: dihydropteroate synthase [candidate division Zixibacteria bacterium]